MDSGQVAGGGRQAGARAGEQGSASESRGVREVRSGVFGAPAK